MLESEKIMFQIYREGSYNRRYHVVYFTELGEHNKDTEINRALAGEPFYDGFIKNYRKDEAKAIIEAAVEKLNNGEPITPEEIDRQLAPYIPEWT